MYKFEQQVEKQSQGRIQVNVYHTGQLGNTEQILAEQASKSVLSSPLLGVLAVKSKLDSMSKSI